jgi:hypothetical protein
LEDKSEVREDLPAVEVGSLIHLSGILIKVDEECILAEGHWLSSVYLLLRDEVNQVLEDSLTDLEDLFRDEEVGLASLNRLFNSLGVALTDALQGS